MWDYKRYYYSAEAGDPTHEVSRGKKYISWLKIVSLMIYEVVLVLDIPSALSGLFELGRIS